MYEGLSSPNIYTVKTLAEYTSTIQSHPEAKLWAGGTNIMSQPDAYPSKNPNEDIIYLGELDDLKHYQRNDRLIEYGSMVSLATLLGSNRTVLPPLLEENILSIGSPLITTRATIGGALMTEGITTSLTGSLVVLNSTIEYKYLKKKRMHSKWTPMMHIIEKGRLSLPPNSLISRIRIAINNAEIQKFFSIGSVIKTPEECVIMAFASNWNQDVLVNPRIAITFPLYGVCASRDLDNCFSALRFPLDIEEYKSLERSILANIESFTTISDLQRERVKGMLEDVVNELNKKTLATTDEYQEEY